MQARYTYRLLRDPKTIDWGSFLLNSDADLDQGVRWGRKGYYISFEGLAMRTRFLRDFGQYACDERREVFSRLGGF